MKFDEKIVHFNIFEVMKYPSTSSSNLVFAISVIDPMVQKVFEIDSRDELEVILTKHIELSTTHSRELGDELQNMVGALQSLATTTTRYGLCIYFYA